MIRAICPSCQSKLNAKDKLAGQTRKCPKCGVPVLIPQGDDASKSSPQPSAGHNDDSGETALRLVAAPQRLSPTNRYLICDRTRVVASWRHDGRGWMLKTTAGLISVKRNRDQIPDRGNFTLVELELTSHQSELRLVGITSYQLSQRALIYLDQGEDKILTAITAPGSLGKEQKNAVHQTIIDQFMHPVWKDADMVLEYLANTDYHSPGTE